MSSNNCYLCASDEGMLLDIFAGGGKAHCAKIETCLSVKIEKRNATSTKICHKCAYELDACSKFVQKYRETRDVREAKGKRPRGHCTLCLEPGKKGYIFDLGEGSPLNNSLRKIREIFNDNFFKDQPSRLCICLNCRYNLDVLFDLKSVYQTTLDKLKDTEEEGTKTSAYTRTKTSVVSRKTTYIPLPELNGDKAYESDSSVSSAMPMRRKRGRPRKDSSSSMGFRTCEQCETAVESGIDMYRYHRTGRTVCKDCWLKMDPEKVTNNKRRKLGLVLKDVLLNPSKYTSMYKVERDEKGNATFLITDDSSENEEKETPLKRTRRSGQGLVKSAKEEAVVPDKKKPVKRVASGKSSNREDEPPAKVAVKEKTKAGAERNGVFTSDSEMMVLRTRRNSIAGSEKTAKAASLSDIETRTQASKKKVGRPRKDRTLSLVSPQKTTGTRTRRSSQRATSTTETSVDKLADKPIGKSTDKPVDKSTNKSADKPIDKSTDKPVDKSNNKSTDKPVDKSTNKSTDKPVDKSTNKSTDKPVDKSVNKSVDKPAVKSVDKPVNKSVDKVERPLRRTRANSFTSQDSASLARRLTGSSLSKTMRPKTKSMSPTSSASEAEPESPFACGVCKAQYKNKLLGMAHELTHSKQPEVKLQRVAIPEIIIEEAPAEASLVEEPEEQSHDVSSTSENGPENAESGERPDAEAPMETETETIVDAKDEAKEKTDSEEATVQIDEKDTKTTEEDSVEIIEKCEKDGKTNVPDDREPETKDEDKKTDEVSANEPVNVDNSTTGENKDEEVTEERLAEDKSTIERSIEEKAEKADSVEKSAAEENEENNKEEKDLEVVVDKEEKHKEEKNEEKKDEENHKEEKDKGEHREEKDKELNEQKDKELNEEKDKELNEEKGKELNEEKDKELNEENDKELSEEKNEEHKEEKDSEEKDKEDSTNNSTEEPVRANGVDADNETESEVDRAEAAKSDVETNARIVEAGAQEESVPAEASETPESKDEGENAASDETRAAEEAENKSLESTLDGAPTETAAGDDMVVRKESESISVVTEVLREVFDLATAEVQKRLETERPNDEKCTTPVPETLENISREIQNSADMPSLEPLVADRSGNDRS